MARTQLSDIDRLKLEAEALWDEQQEVLSHARALAKEAGRQGYATTRRHLEPRVRGAYGSGVAAVGSALATIQAFRDKQVRDVLSGAASLASRAGVPVQISVPKKKSSAGLWIGLGIGAVAAAAVGYVVWQTLRADDDLWIEDEAPEGAAELLE